MTHVLSSFGMTIIKIRKKNVNDADDVGNIL